MGTDHPAPTPDGGERAHGIRAAWTRHRRTGLTTAAVAATAMAVLWWQVVPDAADVETGWRAPALRWGHPVCWALLASSFAVGAADGSRRLRSALAWAALVAYGTFVLALVTSG